MLQNPFFQPILTAFLNVLKWYLWSVKSLSCPFIMFTHNFLPQTTQKDLIRGLNFYRVFSMRSSHYFFNYTKMTQLFARENVKQWTAIKYLLVQLTYRKVASSRLSRLVAHFLIFRRLMKGKFDVYVL